MLILERFSLSSVAPILIQAMVMYLMLMRCAVLRLIIYVLLTYVKGICLKVNAIYMNNRDSNNFFSSLLKHQGHHAQVCSGCSARRHIGSIRGGAVLSMRIA
ncbi:hypothetical protein Drorol1_Dr00003942 [Drosera rotundifolia]